MPSNIAYPLSKVPLYCLSIICHIKTILGPRPSCSNSFATLYHRNRWYCWYTHHHNAMWYGGGGNMDHIHNDCYNTLFTFVKNSLNQTNSVRSKYREEIVSNPCSITCKSRYFLCQSHKNVEITRWLMDKQEDQIIGIAKCNQSSIIMDCFSLFLAWSN